MTIRELQLCLRSTLKLFVLISILSAPTLLKGQNFASVAGEVTDTSGAVIANVNVVLVNTSTGATYQAATNSIGAYAITNVTPGPEYKLTFERDGFKPVVITGVYLNVSSTRTQNVSMSVGNISQTIEVSVADQGVTLDTTDATVGNNFQVQLVNELPIAIRDSPTALFTLQPGTTTDGAVTGARVDQNHVTLDGLDVDDMATGQFPVVIAKAPVDSVQEFRGETAGFLSNTDSGGGGQFQMVTKSGTNKFHGSLFEYHRDTATEANEWFNNNAGIPRTPLIRNQFGGNIGGPIHKDKAFFFFEYNGRRDNLSDAVLRTVPLDSYRNGEISYINNGPGCTLQSRINTTAQCIGTLTPAQVAALDPQGLGFNQAQLDLFNQRYPHANDLTTGDGINTGGFRFNAPVQLNENDYVGRVDYNLNDSMSIWARASVVSQTQGDNVNFAAPIEFPGDPVTHLITDASYAYVVGHTWVISPTKTNQFIYGETRSRLGFPAPYNPQGTTQFTFGGNGTGGTFVSQPFSSVINAASRVDPIPTVRDDFSWIKGSHNFQFGGLFKFIKTHETTVLNYDQPTIGLGGSTPTLDSSLRPADILPSSTTASTTYDSAFATALGRYATYTSSYNYDLNGNVFPQGSGQVRSYRYYETEAYFGDTWKVTPSLTLAYGVRYQWYSVPYETNGFESIQNTNFDQYFGARVAQSAAGQSGATAVPFISYRPGGKANHAPGIYDPSYKNFAPRISFAYNPSFDRKSVFNGGVGLVYDHTVVNAVQFQQDQHSQLFQSSATTPYGKSDAADSLRDDPRFTSLSSGPAPPAANVVTNPYTPFVDAAGQPFGLANGSIFNTIIDPKLRNPYSIIFNFGFQHEFPQNFLLKASYVGRLGRRLLAQADANQLIDFPDGISGQQLSNAFGNITQQVRAGANTANLPAQPWFENVVAPGVGAALGYPNNTSLLADFFTSLVSNGDFADFVELLAADQLIPANVGMGSQFSENTFYTNKGFSAYNGLLVTLHKNTSHGLQFDLNYTWSHSIDNVSLIANQGASGGYGFICDALRPRVCRGNSDFDVTHYITGNFIYNLPFGRGRSFAATSPFWLNEIIGGWDLSGLPSWHSGNAFGTVSSAFVAGYANDAPAILVGNRTLVSPHAHKEANGTVNLFADSTAAQGAFIGPIGFNIGSRNNLRGPNFFNLDLGLAKTFPLVSDKLNLKFRADAFNAFNHASFAVPGGTNSTPNNPGTAPEVDITTGSFGQITATATNARVMQFALRLEF